MPQRTQPEQSSQNKENFNSRIFGAETQGKSQELKRSELMIVLIYSSLLIHLSKAVILYQSFIDLKTFREDFHCPTYFIDR